MKRTTGILVLLLAIGAAFAGGIWFARSGGAVDTNKSAASKSGRKVLYYVDPMHPAYKSDKPGIAPDCGMKLEPVYEDSGEVKAKVLYYRDPQDSAYKSDKPGLNPATGNDLEAVYEGMPEPGTVQVSAEKQQLIGIKYATAAVEDGTEIVRAVGRIAPDETRITRVHPRIDGWIQKVHVDFMGQSVRKGDPLLTLYSPDLLATQQEYLLALKARDTMKAGPSHDAYENSELLILAARRRLELWDLSEPQLDELERTRKPVQTVTLYSPASGYITSRNAFPSQRVSPETELYAITDLSKVWIMADVFEADIAKIQAGQTAGISMPSANGAFNAKVNYIQPQVDPNTRALKVRLEAANPDLKLKPDMFVNVDFRIGLQNRVTIPADAVINTGLRKTVFIDRGNGQLEAREVQTGERNGERIQILTGVRAGERVVASGAFLIDSEAQLKNAMPAGKAHSARAEQ